LTVTPAKGHTPAERAKNLASAWRIIVKRAKRQLKLTQLEYLAVFEKTKRGEPHLHILARCGYIPQRWLSEQMREITGAPVVWIEAVTSEKQAARYVAKYCAKDPHRFGTCKRYWHTRNYSLETSEEEEANPWGEQTWEKVEITTDEMYRRWWFEGKCPGAVAGRELVKLGDGLTDLIYYGEPPPALRRRWERPEDLAPPAAAPCTVIAPPGCTV
jgi:hypothetical protein